ncbi:MAG: GNAT family N-acetyltransferase [Acidobacteriota bacterium]|nr:GNAT family N-acetyltransferase [Acidobacteriota bacterium]
MKPVFVGKTRPMTEADLDAVVAMAEASPTAPHWARAAYEQATHSDSTPARIALVAETDAGALAGFAVASLVPPEAELESIVAAAALQRRGVGRALVEALRDTLRRRGVRVLHLEVRASNEAALSLYAVTGFAESGIRPRYYADPIEDSVLLSLDLG